ncbi:hypothetical protein RhiJN_22799 [Ceratobasidium sp. AG-Ba]|nr:hypothetical protein RhiJN_22799 [Ceratobasidium sp. AG-Ba]
MSRTKELPLIPVSESLLEHDLQHPSSLKQPHTYTVTFSFSFGTVMGLGDTFLGIVVLRIVSVVVAAGGFIVVSRPSPTHPEAAANYNSRNPQSLAVILLAPYFPSLVSAVPPQASSLLGAPQAVSSPYRRQSMRRPAPVAIQVSVRRDPNITPIIERRDSASPSPAPAPPNRRVSFSPQSSSTSVPIAAPEIPSAPSSSTGHGHVMHSPGLSMRSVCDRVKEREREPGYILPTPPASITSVSSEGDDTETLVDEFGTVSASPSVGKRGRSFPFVGRRKDKGKDIVRDGSGAHSESGLFGSRKRAQSLGYVVEDISQAKTGGVTSPSGQARRATSEINEPLRESETEGSTRGTDKEDRASRSAVDKEARRRSGLSFQDFKAAFGKRERRGSATLGAYTLSSHPHTTPAEPGRVPRTPQPHSALGKGRPSSVQISPRAASDGAASARRRSMPLKLDTGLSVESVSVSIERAELQSPLQQRPLFGGGEVVIRNESGRLRTRSSAIPGLYADAEVLQRL